MRTGSTVLTLQAHDLDLGANANLTYDLLTADVSYLNINFVNSKES
jgi:hypothetical protein